MPKSHNKKISVDLRGFHIFDDGDSSSDEQDDGIAKKKAARAALKDRIKHAQKMSVDLGGYHLFDDGSSSEDEDEDEAAGMSGPKKSQGLKKMHNKKISVDLRGFDLFDDSSDESDSDGSSDGPGRVDTAAGTSKKAISEAANAEFKKAQRMYLQENEDDDLKGFHLFDEYNDDDSDEDVVKLHEMAPGQLTALVRSLLVENAILKDAASRARTKLDNRKEMIKALETNKRDLIKVMAEEMNNMRDIIRSLGGVGGGAGRTRTVS